MKTYPTYRMKQALEEAKRVEEMFKLTNIGAPTLQKEVEDTHHEQKKSKYPCLVEVQELPAIHSVEVGDEGVCINTHNHSTYQATTPEELTEILEAIRVLEEYYLYA